METSDQEAAWQRWVTEHSARLLLYARQKSRCEADAQDLVQESVLEAARRCAGQPPPAALVFGTIHRRAIDLARREDRRAGRERAAADVAVEPWFDSAAMDRELSRLLDQALKQLPEHYREVVTLKIWGGLTFAEMGDVLRTSPNTVASRYRYALEELRKIARGVFA